MLLAAIIFFDWRFLEVLASCDLRLVGCCCARYSAARFCIFLYFGDARRMTKRTRLGARVLSAASKGTESGTDRYYRDHALAYAESTLGEDMSEIYDRFLGHLPKSAKILDAGSGSGRDTLAFKNLGYDVDAFDASPALCAFSTQLTGVPTRVQTFQDFESEPVYDGIWACASLLHVQADELSDAVRRLVHALKHEGAFYMSFKHGSGERHSEDGRFYLDMDEVRLHAVLNGFADARLTDIWVSPGEGSRRGRDAWKNAILVKSPGANSNRG